MTPEEIAKYGTAKPQTKTKLGDEEYMKKLNISTEELLEDCKEFGTDWEACKVIGEKRKLTQKQVSNLILARGIKKLIEIKEHSLGLSETKSERPHEDYLNTIAFANEIRDRTAKQRLRPKTLLSQTICGFEYELRDECLLLRADINVDLEIAWGSFDDFIKDLQEIKIIAGK